MGLRSLFWEMWGYYGPWRARWNGWIDGRRGIPAKEDGPDTHARYEYELKQRIEADLRRLEQTWLREDERLIREYVAARAELRASEARERNAEEEERRASEEYERQRAQHGGITGAWRPGNGAYYSVLAAILVGEVPLNRAVFRLLGGPEVETTFLALVLGVVIAFTAHLTGTVWRRASLRENVSPVEEMGALVLVALFTLSAFGIGYLREAYVAAEASATGITINPWAAGGIFALLQCLLFAVATLFAYFRLDPAHHAVQYARRALREAERDLALAQRARLEAEKRLDQIRGTRENGFARYHSRARWYNDVYQADLEIYRKHNRRSRRDNYLPPSFREYPEINIPERLTTLTWPDGEEDTDRREKG